jgi:hypothetical protein
LAISERTEIAKHMPQLLAIAASMSQVNREPDATDAFLLPLMALPVQGATEQAGEAAAVGYRIGLAKVPNRLLRLAVERALQDSARRFRPGPTELLAYVAEEMAAIRRRLHRLEQMRLYPARDVAAEPAELTPEQREEMMAKMEALADRLGARANEARAADAAEREPSILAPREPDVPRVETMVAAHGISRADAEAKVAEILSKRGQQ